MPFNKLALSPPSTFLPPAPARCGAGALAALAALVVLATTASAHASIILPVHWTGGGASAGVEGIGNATDMVVDASGNLAIVSGSAHLRDLAVTSYDPAGALRWQTTLRPESGTYATLFNEIVAAPGGDVVVVGYFSSSQPQLARITLARLASDGTVRWRIDPNLTVRDIGSLVVDDQGNAYLPFLSTLHKYSPTGDLLWERPTGSREYATALSSDSTLIVVAAGGGGMWRTTAFDTATGTQRWTVAAAEGTAATDVAIDATRVYVTGQGTVGLRGVLSVVAYDRATGARLWRTDSAPAGTDPATGLHIALAPSGGVVVAADGAGGGYWWTAAIDATGAIRWQARRDRATNAEVPTDVMVLPDGTAVVTGASGPEIQDGLGNTYLRGVTVGYSPAGTLLWEALSTLPTRATALHNGDVCATGGYDALITCFRLGVGIPTAAIAATPITGDAPLTVDLSGQGSTSATAALASWAWTLGDGATATTVQLAHTYATPGTYDVVLEVTDTLGAIGFAVLPIVVTGSPSPDADGDGVTAATDCDDGDPAVHPGAVETCDGVDNDCDGAVDRDLSQACCGTGVAMCTAGAWGACSITCDAGTGGAGDAGSGVDAEQGAGCCSGAPAAGGGPALVLGVLGLALITRQRRRR